MATETVYSDNVDNTGVFRRHEDQFERAKPFGTSCCVFLLHIGGRLIERLYAIHPNHKKGSTSEYECVCACVY